MRQTDTLASILYYSIFTHLGHTLFDKGITDRSLDSLCNHVKPTPAPLYSNLHVKGTSKPWEARRNRLQGWYELIPCTPKLPRGRKGNSHSHGRGRGEAPEITANIFVPHYTPHAGDKAADIEKLRESPHFYLFRNWLFFFFFFNII